jgi:hypothetical protein
VAKTRHDKYARTIKGRYRTLKYRAKIKKTKCNITFEQYVTLVTGASCHYCKGPLDQTGCGIDRKDNDKGYEIENISVCCGTCNMIKGSALTYQEALVAIAAIIAMRKGSDDF